MDAMDQNPVLFVAEHPPDLAVCRSGKVLSHEPLRAPAIPAQPQAFREPAVVAKQVDVARPAIVAMQQPLPLQHVPLRR